MSDMALDNFYFDDSFLKAELSQIDLSGLTGGKYLRSRLLYLTGKIFDLNDSDLTKLGRVVELVHNATLTHDDVIDNSHTRRGSPSIPALINNKKSVLVGDYMLAKALHELSDFNNPKLTAQLTLTLKELVEGEWIQFENTNPYKISYKIYETLCIKKTGSLFRWSFLAPLLTTETSQKVYDLFSEFGEQLGIIFQMTDDIIDFNKESKKSYGLDFANNNINFVLQFVGNKYPELSETLLRTDTIYDLSQDHLNIIDEAKSLAQDDVSAKLSNCKNILNQLRNFIDEKYDISLINELDDILDLIKDRVY